MSEMPENSTRASLPKWLKRVLIGVALFAGLLAAAYAALPYLMSYQTKDASAFESEIATFETQDSAGLPAPGHVLFIGSSSIRRWETLEQDMAPIQVLNRGFGGSMLHHSTHYFDRIVTPYQPSAIVMYAGGNDISNLIAPRSADMVFQDFEEFIAKVRADLGPVPVVYISIKPSVLREKFWPEMQKVNQAIQGRAQADKLIYFIDGATPLLGSDGKPSPEFLVWDGLHLNAEGYAEWAALVQPTLVSIMEGQ